MTTSNFAKGLKSALLLGAATAAAISLSTPASAATVETVVVTGSRIPTKDFASNSPVATVQGEAIREIGTSTIESYLNTLPQFTPAFTKTQNNPQGGGLATLDLRNLGPQRTLILLDGRRMIGATSGTVDLSILPSSLIERVEVVTGGASAVYGSDALAGVVNFILKKDFEGLQVSLRGGISEHGDGEEHRIDTTLGGNFGGGKGNITAVLTYEHRTGIGEASRPFSRNAEACDTGPVVGGPIHCTRNGSPTTPDGTITIANGITQAAVDAYFANPAHGGLPAGTATVDQIGFNPDGTLFFTSATNTAFPVTNYKGPFTEYDPGIYTYNFNPTNLLTTPFKRVTGYVTGFYEVVPHVEAYATMLFTNYTARTQLAPTPASLTLTLGPAFAAGTLPPDLLGLYAASGTPVTAADTRTISVSRRTLELGPRAGSFDNNAFQLLFGVRGDFAGLVEGTTWHYDVYTSYGRYVGNTLFNGYVSTSRVRFAASGCPTGAAAGPSGALQGPPGVPCTALNIFGAGSISQANANYINEPYYDVATNLLADTQAVVSGDAFNLWAGPVGFAVGTEYRDVFYQDFPDIALQVNDITGANASAVTRGGYNVLEGFAETKIPLLADMWGINYAGVEAGIRYSHYSTGRNVTTLKAGGEIDPWEWLKIRAMYQHAIRAANVSELFANAQGGFPAFQNTTDPCNPVSPERTGVALNAAAKRPNGSGGTANAAAVAALCAAQAPGIVYGNTSLFSYGANGQIFSISGGNPNLAPETENNYTLGIVLRPGEHLGSFLSHFTATVDYYNLVLKGVISTVSPVTALTRCYDPGYNPTYSITNNYCQAIHRDPASGSVSQLTNPNGFVSAQNQNLSSWKISGVDTEIVFNTDLSEFGFDESWGSLMVADSLGFLDRFKIQQLPGEAYTNIAGTIGDGTPNRDLARHPALPNWKNTFRVNWNVGDFSLGWRMYTIGATDNFHPAPDLPNSAITHVPLTTYHYLNARWNFDDNWSMFGGVDNVADQQPPRYTAAFQYTVDPSTYDVVGRFFYAGVTLKY
ncbi:MAG: TonB-dependent receptor [Alphaproteobacteria bacterium]|nr:TonB-dependent receptor [Alphaproteobacteria bacterium]MBV9418382.1 TonB-dependent receptor [Alphaproteobacteria bacterium]MBV9539638.1 TonB-dependent receptor [Alphaproteobacteria bacterium]